MIFLHLLSDSKAHANMTNETSSSSGEYSDEGIYI